MNSLVVYASGATNANPVSHDDTTKKVTTEQDAARGIAVGLTRFMEDNIDIILKTNENLFSILDRQANLPFFGA